METIPEKWKKEYFQKSGDTHICTENLTINKHGFASYHVGADYIRIIQEYGDGKFWDDYFTSLARRLKKKQLIVSTKRDPAAITRKYGYNFCCTVMSKEV